MFDAPHSPTTAGTNTARGARVSDRTLLAAGVVGPLHFIVVLLIEGATRPGYSAWRHFVSQLSLSDQGWEQIANFVVCAVLCLAFAVGLRRALGGGTGATWGPILIGLFALGLLTAGSFATDPALGYPPGTQGTAHQTLHGTIHGLAGLVAFASLSAACFVLARRFARDPAWRRWGPYSVVTGIIVAASFVVSNTTAVFDMIGTLPNAPTGLLQRIGIILGWGWIALLAWRLLHAAPPAALGTRGAAGSRSARAAD